MVAGNFKRAKKIAEGTWEPREVGSKKGPNGSTGLWGDMEGGEWTEIGEESFWEGVRAGLVRLE